MNQSNDDLIQRQDALVRALERSIESVCTDINKYCNSIRDDTICTISNFNSLTYILEALEAAEAHIIIAAAALKNLNKITPPNRASTKIPIIIE